MIVTPKETYLILEDEYDSVKDFATYLEKVIPLKYRDNNLIINLLKYHKLSLDELLCYLNVSNNQRGSRKSFVVVNQAIDYDLIPDEMIVVPTLQEAGDIIEMEEIERDLGF